MSEAPLDPATPADMPQQLPDAVSDAAPAPEDAKPAPTRQEFDDAMRKLRNENHNLRTKLRETEPLAKKAQEADEAAKSETQKANERAQAAEERERATLEGYARLELAVQHGIPPEDIDLIGSGSREEMETRARRIAQLNAAASKAQPPPTDRPVEGLRPGATPEPPRAADDSYPEQWKPTWLRGGEKESSIFHGQ